MKIVSMISENINYQVWNLGQRERRGGTGHVFRKETRQI